jgi:hypothetical protein
LVFGIFFFFGEALAASRIIPHPASDVSTAGGRRHQNPRPGKWEMGNSRNEKTTYICAQRSASAPPPPPIFLPRFWALEKAHHFFDLLANELAGIRGLAGLAGFRPALGELAEKWGGGGD